MAKAVAQSDFVGTVSAVSDARHSVVDYSKFDKLDLGSDEEGDAADAKRAERTRLRHSLIQQRASMKAAQLRGEGYADQPEINVNQRLIDAGFAPDKPGGGRDGDGADESCSSSSEDDSDIESIPLFWKKLPKNWKENETIRAMQFLKDETPLDELAEDMKEQGNDWYKRVLEENPTGTRLLTYQRNALRCYTTGLNYAHSAAATPEVRALHATLLVNRAAVQLARKNYRKAIRDCRGALRFDGDNLKAHYRAAQALLKLKRYDEAHVHAEAAHALVQASENSKNKALAKCRRGIARGIQQRDAERAAAAKKEAAKNAMMQEIQAGCAARGGIRMGPCLMRLGMEPRSVRPKVFGVVGGSGGSGGGQVANCAMAWPVMLLYEEHAQHDFVQQVADDTCLRDLLEMVLPEKDGRGGGTPPWDEDQKYVCSNVELFFETRCVPAFPNDGTPWPTDFPVQTEAQASTGRLREWVQVPLGLTLLDVLTFPEYVVPQVVTFHVVPKSGSFHTEFLRRNKGKLRKLFTQAEAEAAAARAARVAEAKKKTKKKKKKKKGDQAGKGGGGKGGGGDGGGGGAPQASSAAGPVVPAGGEKKKRKKKKKNKKKKMKKKNKEKEEAQTATGGESGEAVPSSDLD